MSERDKSTFFGVISTALEFRNRLGAAKIKTNYVWRKRASIAFLLFITFLVIFYVYKLTTPPKTPRSRKTKRHIKPELLYQHDSDRHPTFDVQIVPENFQKYSSSIPIKYPNHRYTETEPESIIYKGLVDQVQERRDRFPLQPKSKSSGKSKTFVSGLSQKGFVPTMRIKGIYMQSPKEKSKSEEKLSYSKEINNLMQNGFESEGKGREGNPKKGFKIRGAPFRLPGRRNTEKSGHKPKGRPMTILLDFYPMAGGPSRRRKLGKNGEGLLMKLNLYPKERLQEERENRPKGKPLSRYNKKAERKSFGWFAKEEKKKKRHSECSIFGLNPDGKHITAKWKDENGDWIHAKHVKVKYLKKEND